MLLEESVVANDLPILVGAESKPAVPGWKSLGQHYSPSVNSLAERSTKPGAALARRCALKRR